MRSPKQKRNLRSRAHALKPVVITGRAGVSDAVLAEIERALDHHELIKVRIRVMDREQRTRMIARVQDQTGAEIVQKLGQTVTLYRKNPSNK